MREYTRHKQTSRTPEQPRASRQAPAGEILQQFQQKAQRCSPVKQNHQKQQECTQPALQLHGANLQAMTDTKPVQLFAKAGDTVNLEAHQPKEYIIMHNPTYPSGGEEPKSDIGSTDILNATHWGPLGISPRDYHRAHAISNAFGGGGDADNVAWWSSVKEQEWTDHEEKVRGAGANPIPDWTPGDTEKGDYKVTRTLQQNIDFVPRYQPVLVNAGNWGLDDTRPAWARFKNDHPTLLQKGEKIREKYKNSLPNYFTGTLKNMGYHLAGKHLIEKMKMEYNRTQQGNAPGTLRNDLALELSADNMDVNAFGLQNQPQALWEAMVAKGPGKAFQQNFLATGNKVLPLPWGGPASDVPKPAPIILSPQKDGWGIP